MSQFIQSQVGTSTTSPVTCTISTANGSTLIALVSTTAGSTGASTVSDGTNTWNRLENRGVTGGTNSRCELWVAFATSSVSSVQATWSNATGSILTVIELTAAVTANDQHTGLNNASSTTVGTGSITDLVATDAIVAVCSYGSTHDPTTHNNDGGIWGADTANTSSTVEQRWAYAEVAATGTYSDSWTQNSAGVSGTAIASFQFTAVSSISIIRRVSQAIFRASGPAS